VCGSRQRQSSLQPNERSRSAVGSSDVASRPPSQHRDAWSALWFSAPLF